MSDWSADRKHGSGRPGGNRFNSNDWNKRKRQNFSNPSRQVGSYAGKGRSTAYFSGPLRYQQNRRGSQFDDDRRFYGQPGRRNFWYGNDRKFFEDDEGSRFSPLRNDYRKQRNTNREFLNSPLLTLLQQIDFFATVPGRTSLQAFSSLVRRTTTI